MAAIQVFHRLVSSSASLLGLSGQVDARIGGMRMKQVNGYIAAFAIGCAFTTAMSAFGVMLHGGLSAEQHLAPFGIMSALAAWAVWAAN